MDKKKVFVNCLAGLKTDGDKVACWEGTPFMTTAGPCKVPSLANCVMK